VFALVLGVTACGGDGGDSGSGGATGGASGGTSVSAPAIAKDAALAAQVPAAIATTGVLVVGTDASYAPNEFIAADGTTVVGFDADLATAVGAVLGLKVELRNAPFGTLVEGVKTGKYDLGMSSFTINADRMAQVDMISYYTAGTSWAVETGNPTGLTPENACGRKVAVQKDTVQVADVTSRSAACVKAGHPAITIEQFPLQSDATSAVVTGKDDGLLADSPIVAYAAQQTGGRLQVVGSTYDTAPYGIAVQKGSGGLAAAVQGAVQKLIDGGQYRAVLQRWNVTDGAVATARLNPAS
jgi:polar amino acid transport system substrate-binding protein